MPPTTTAPSAPHHTPRLPRVTRWLLGALLPTAERMEVMEELAAELAERRTRYGVVRARLWLSGQLIRSLPELVRRSWWRGMSGFEPEANRLTPGGFFMEAWIIDFRYAARRLRSRPTYALLAVLTLALGVGGTAAIYAVVRGLLLSPLPYEDEHELVRFWMMYSWSEEEFVHLRDRFPGFERVAAYRPDDVTLRSSDGRARFAGGLASSAELFEVLGTRPAIGPGFTEGNDVPGAADEVILSDGLWRELGGTPSLVGSRLDIDGVQRTVVGVMPAGFWFPDPSVRLWMTTGLRPDNGAGNYTFVGRMSPGLSLEQMNAPLQRLTAMLNERFDYPPQWDPTVNPELTPIRTALLGEVRPPLLATLAAMAAILLIACANVAALMLGQSDSRASEFAVRTALGAGVRRIARQLIAEALLLGLAAGAAGALVAAAGLRTLTNSLPLGSLANTVSLEWALVLHATLIALAAALAISVWPAVALWRGNVRGALSASRTSGVQSGGRLEGVMVTAQITLAVVLCVGAALVTRSVANLTSISTGVNADGVGVVDFTLPSSDSPAERRQAIAEVARAVAALPGVQSAGATHKLPLRGPGSNTGLEIEGRPEITGVTTFFRIVTPEYLSTLGVPLTDGQHFDGSETGEGEPAIVVNAEFARRYFPDEPPVGRRVSNGFGAMGRVVGVVENVAEAALTDSVTPARYVLYSQLSFIPEDRQEDPYTFAPRREFARHSASRRRTPHRARSRPRRGRLRRLARRAA